MTVRKRKLDALRRKEHQVSVAVRSARSLGFGRTSKIRVALHPTWREAFDVLRGRDPEFFRGLPIEYDDQMTRRAVSMRGLSVSGRFS